MVRQNAPYDDGEVEADLKEATRALRQRRA
jgi:hypothetical protein